MIIGGKAQVKATGSAEHHGSYIVMVQALPLAMAERLLGAVVPSRTARINLLLPTTSRTVQKEMTNIGHNGSNTVTQTRQDNKWVTNGEQPPEKCSHSNTYAAEKVSPTCTEKGSQTYRCSSCGEIIRVEEVAQTPDIGTMIARR